MAGKRSVGATLTMTKAGAEVEDLVLANVANIGKIKTDTGEIESTTLDSPNNAKEFIAGFKDSGEFDVELNNVFDGQAATLEAVFAAGETRAWTIGFMDGVTSLGSLGLNAFIKGREFGELAPEGLHKITLTLRISGAPAYTEV